MIASEYFKVSFVIAFIFICINALIHAYAIMSVMIGIAIIQIYNLYLWNKGALQ